MAPAKFSTMMATVSAAALGWPLYFISTALAALPALALMVWLQQRGHFRALDAEE
jgi:PAT family beta-lactamase induction signal transducer AmpG